MQIRFLKMGISWPLLTFIFFLLVTISISIITIQIEKSADGVLGIRTRGCSMVGADENTELMKTRYLGENFVVVIAVLV